MALLLRPANVQKNVAATFTIDFTELAALSKVPAGKYKDPSNWMKVTVRVVHSTSGQKKDIVYTLPSNTADLLVSDSARAGTWEIYSIVIKDFDRGEIVLHQSDIPSVAGYNFFVVSAATHGDLIVGSGQTVTIPANADRQYGDLIVEAGGTLALEDGGGIAVLDVLGNCVINGTVLGKSGKHTGGTWNKVSPLGETLTHTVVQKAGGKGGAGEAFTGTALQESFNSTLGPFALVSGQSTVVWTSENGGSLNSNYTISGQDPKAAASFTTIPGQVYTVTANLVKRSGSGIAQFGLTAHDGAVGAGASLGVAARASTGSISFTFTASSATSSIKTFHGADFGMFDMTDVSVSGFVIGGLGGNSAFGNGGAGGRSRKFVAQDGDTAIDVEAGQGAGQASVADEYGENGLDATAPAQTAGGGFRGAHGQCLYIKARQIQGSGVIDVSGQKGGDGGDGGEFLSEGELYANGPGGGAAGGEGGKVWLRAKKGTPVLTINTLGGEKGSRGVASPGATEAEHGQAGSNGAYNFSLF